MSMPYDGRLLPLPIEPLTSWQPVWSCTPAEGVTSIHEVSPGAGNRVLDVKILPAIDQPPWELIQVPRTHACTALATGAHAALITAALFL
jgi:hypothetical protein